MANNPELIVNGADASDAFSIPYDLMAQGRHPQHFVIEAWYRDVVGTGAGEAEVIDGTLKFYATNHKNTDDDVYTLLGTMNVNAHDNKYGSFALPMEYPFFYLKLIYTPNSVTAGEIYVNIYITDK